MVTDMATKLALRIWRGSLMVLIHFHLKEPIMVSRRKTFEIQFYTEVRAQTEEKDEDPVSGILPWN